MTITNKTLLWKAKKAIRKAQAPQVTPHSESLGVGFRLPLGSKRR